jgi:hypothetical protein
MVNKWNKSINRIWIIWIKSIYHMFIDKYGYIYMSEYSTHEVTRFTSNSSAPAIIAGNTTPGSLSNQFNIPCGIYVDDNLTFYIADFANHRIQMSKYGTSFGQTIVGDGTAGSFSTGLNFRADIVVHI